MRHIDSFEGVRMSEEKKPKKEFWFARIQEWQASGLGKMAYCRYHNISPTTFYYWQNIFKKKSFVKPTATSLIPVRPISVEKHDIVEKIEVKLPSGIVIHIPASIGSERIGQLILSLGERG